MQRRKRSRLLKAQIIAALSPTCRERRRKKNPKHWSSGTDILELLSSISPVAIESDVREQRRSSLRLCLLRLYLISDIVARMRERHTHTRVGRQREKEILTSTLLWPGGWLRSDQPLRIQFLDTPNLDRQILHQYSICNARSGSATSGGVGRVLISHLDSRHHHIARPVSLSVQAQTHRWHGNPWLVGSRRGATPWRRTGSRSVHPLRHRLRLYPSHKRESFRPGPHCLQLPRPNGFFSLSFSLLFCPFFYLRCYAPLLLLQGLLLMVASGDDSGSVWSLYIASTDDGGFVIPERRNAAGKGVRSICAMEYTE